MHQRRAQYRQAALVEHAGRPGLADLLVEGEHEHFVFGIAHLGKLHGGGDHALAFGRHAGAVVDQQADGCRRVRGREEAKLLRRVVFVDQEVVLLEAGYRRAAPVFDHRVDHDEIRRR